MSHWRDSEQYVVYPGYIEPHLTEDSHNLDDYTHNRINECNGLITVVGLRLVAYARFALMPLIEKFVDFLHESNEPLRVLLFRGERA